MKKFSIILLGISIVFLFFWQIPWLYSFITPQKDNSAFVLYSPILNDFTYSHSEGKKLIHIDSEGNYYTQYQIDSLQPVFYGRQLLTDNRFPDSIAGNAASYKESQHNSFYYRISPRDLNAPQIGVYQMLESMSGRVKLETPEDVFRITSQGIEFVDIANNRLNEEKSKLFTDAMIKKSFAFPAKHLSGIPSVKKDYDEGYLMLDSENKLFHIKQVKGRPYVRNIEIPGGINPEYVFITEFRNRAYLGFLTDDKHQMYAITSKDYDFIKVGIPAFNPKENGMMIYGLYYQWTIKVSSKEKAVIYAIDGNDLSLLKTYEVPQSENFITKLGELISKIGIRFTDPLDKFVYPRFGY